jgi:hypothetical protein
MLRSILSGLIAVPLFTALSLLATPSAAQALDVPIYEQESDGQAANCGDGKVMGLKEGSDGFLAVRTGPGSNYRKIGELHNGDHVTTIDYKNGWYGVLVPRGRIDQKDACERVGPKRRLSGSGLGWVHGRWIGDIIP